MKKLKYLLLILPFLFFSKVNAQIISSDVSLNGSALNTRMYKYVSANEYATMTITATNSSYSGYFRVQACFDADITAYYLSNTDYFSDALVVRTKTPCTYYNSSYEGGTVTNFYFNYDVSASGATSFTTSFNFLNFGGSFGLLSVASSDVPFDVSSGLDYSDSNIDTSGIEQKQTETNEKLDETNQNIKETNDTLKDDNIDTSKTTIEDKSADASNSPISSLLTLPLKLLENIQTGLNGTCAPFNLGNLFGTDLILPCIDFGELLGPFLWGLIDALFYIFMAYNIGMLAIKIWTDVIMMKDFFSELYKPSGEKGGKKE